MRSSCGSRKWSLRVLIAMFRQFNHRSEHFKYVNHWITSPLNRLRAGKKAGRLANWMLVERWLDGRTNRVQPTIADELTVGNHKSEGQIQSKTDSLQVVFRASLSSYRNNYRNFRSENIKWVLQCHGRTKGGIYKMIKPRMRTKVRCADPFATTV